MCHICNLPDSIPCSCPGGGSTGYACTPPNCSTTPECTFVSDAHCVAYNIIDPEEENGLECLDLPNGASVHRIFNKLSEKVCAAQDASSSGISGTSGNNGTSGTGNGQSGSSGTSGISGTSVTGQSITLSLVQEIFTVLESDSGLAIQFCNIAALCGYSATSGTSGTSGGELNATSGSSGTSGDTLSASGDSGSSGTSGVTGTDGTSGTSGDAGADGTSGTTGITGTSGTSGTTGNFSSGTSGSSGSSGTSGETVPVAYCVTAEDEEISNNPTGSYCENVGGHGAGPHPYIVNRTTVTLRNPSTGNPIVAPSDIIVDVGYDLFPCGAGSMPFVQQISILAGNTTGSYTYTALEYSDCIQGDCGSQALIYIGIDGNNLPGWVTVCQPAPECNPPFNIVITENEPS